MKKEWSGQESSWISFLLWGFLHGAYQVVGYILHPLRKKLERTLGLKAERNVYKCMEIAVTFLLVNFAWIFFRLTKINDAFYVVKEIIMDVSPWVLMDGSLLDHGVDSHQWHIVLLFIGITLLVDYLHEKNSPRALSCC